MTTRKELIVEKYCRLQQVLLNYFDVSIFPDLSEIDVSDMVFLTTYQFLNINTNEEYTKKIREMLLCHDLEMNEKDLGEILPIIVDFVKWLKAL